MTAMRKCNFCGCKTNAVLRACCWMGREHDLTAAREKVRAAGVSSLAELTKILGPEVEISGKLGGKYMHQDKGESK